MPENPLVSILVANYNNGCYFKDFYNSLISQTYQHWEVIIVDDKSTDNSIALITDLIQHDTRFKLFKNNENMGVGFTKKRCIELSSGGICGFVDPDDAITENALTIMMDHILKKPGFSIYYSNFIYCDKNLVPRKIRKTFQVESEVSTFYNMAGEISHLAFFSKKYYLMTEGLNDKMKRAIDQDLYLKLYDISAGKVFYIDEDLYYYRIHENGISSNSNSKKALFWQWVAIVKAAQRNNINIEDSFLENWVPKQEYVSKIQSIKQSRFLKLAHKLGMFKGYEYL